MNFRPAIRENVGLLIGLAGASGSGKTFSAMRLATGISGDRSFASYPARVAYPELPAWIEAAWEAQQVEEWG